MIAQIVRNQRAGPHLSRRVGARLFCAPFKYRLTTLARHSKMNYFLYHKSVLCKLSFFGIFYVAWQHSCGFWEPRGSGQKPQLRS